MFREVNIEDAIAASQADNQTSFASQGDRGRVHHVSGRSKSIDATLVLDTGKKKGRKLFGKKVSSSDKESYTNMNTYSVIGTKDGVV